MQGPGESYGLAAMDFDYVPASPGSNWLDLGFDATLLRYRRFADLDSRVLLYSPQSVPPQPQQVRAAYPVADDGLWAAGCGRYGSKHEAGRLAGAPGFQASENHISLVSQQQTSSNPPPTVPGASTPIKLPADFRLPEGNIAAANTELSTPGPAATTTPADKSSAEPEPAVEDDEVTQALYGHSGRRRLPIFTDICPE